MQRALLAFGALAGVVAVYFLAWPVPVDPVAWSPPADEGLTGAYSPNEILALARGIDLGGHTGPEDVAIDGDGALYASVLEGAIVRIRRRGNPVVFAETGGRPLGIDALPDGAFVVANAVLGLQRVETDGRVSVLVDRTGDVPLRYTNGVAAAASGRIYLTEASTKFGAAEYGGTLEASLLDILEHGGHGRLLEHDPATGVTRLLLDRLNFANGVAVSENQQYLLLAETGSYRILRYWIAGPRRGASEVLLDNLPGFPDNVDNGLNGRYWIGLVAPRNRLLDRYAGRPFLRKLMQRLPPALRPEPGRSSHVIAIDGDGQVLMNLQDPDARFPLLTGTLELPDRLILTTLDGPVLPWIDKNDLL
ncbi:MAG TPA: SMP-30/gluconolactonase/LRE family protein [Woeseiaceae bacterium]|nr:SMP-30/gluconolactonase/LRE family protein [Woeseiaceae bacterium]